MISVLVESWKLYGFPVRQAPCTIAARINYNPTSSFSVFQVSLGHLGAEIVQHPIRSYIPYREILVNKAAATCGGLR